MEKNKWNSTYWNDIDKYNNRNLRGLKEYLLINKDHLSSYIREIKAVPNKTIKEIIEGVAANLLTATQKKVLSKFLIRRKKRLDSIVKRYVNGLST
ncbi:hypothetical protein CR203_03975 [Salipaludibacillus neizhouensis]|uniref:Uncharacterized protein n=1 Tax=Salipaludibacillus neizhouensis TaxID=885475 RepID=A0A3A9KAN1_9BACI|nr:hypothetical protein [Salipaludibacillus neizhouensis]RKL69199.1 hypothetical protein CR203_03975 [Salipaludibacillus neizhouensis]